MSQLTNNVKMAIRKYETTKGRCERARFPTAKVRDGPIRTP